MSHPAATSVACRCARRALIVLGGAFVWWLFMSGAAHADDGTSGSDVPARDAVQRTSETDALPTQRARGAAAVRDALERTTGPVTDTLRTAPRRATTTLTTLTRNAPEPVGSTATQLTAAAEPRLTTTTTWVADTVDRTATVAGALLAPESRTTDRPAPQPLTSGVRAGAGGRALPGPAPTAAASTYAGAGAVSPLPGPAPDRGVSGPPVPETPATPTSGTGSSHGGALLSGLILIAPGPTPRRRSWDDDTPGAGPAYPPGCSPD